MLVPRGRFYRRQKTRSRTGSASIFRAVRPQARAAGPPQRPLATRKRTCSRHENAPSAGCAGCAGCACGGGAALPLLIGHRIIVIRPARGTENIRVHRSTRRTIHTCAPARSRERERERRERERESLMQQGMVMHVTVLRLTCNGLRSRAGASCELGAPSQRRTLSSACSARRTWSTQSVSGLGRVLRSDPRTSRTYCGAT